MDFLTGLSKDANGGDGFMDPKILAQCIREAKDAGWKAGAMAWEVSCHLLW